MEKRLNLPTFGKNDATGLIIGNTKHLWKPFTKHIVSLDSKIPPNPLDVYSMQSNYQFFDF